MAPPGPRNDRPEGFRPASKVQKSYRLSLRTSAHAGVAIRSLTAENAVKCDKMGIALVGIVWYNKNATQIEYRIPILGGFLPSGKNASSFPIPL